MLTRLWSIFQKIASNVNPTFSLGLTQESDLPSQNTEGKHFFLVNLIYNISTTIYNKIIVSNILYDTKGRSHSERGRTLRLKKLATKRPSRIEKEKAKEGN